MSIFTLIAGAGLGCGLWIVGCAAPPAKAQPPATRSSTSPVASDLEMRLAEKISIAGLNFETMERIIPYVLADTSIKYEIDHEAFIRSGIDPAKRRVMHAPAHDIARGKLLQEILDQVPARYYREGDTLRIVPSRDGFPVVA
jgi:hypothetical protein